VLPVNRSLLGSLSLPGPLFPVSDSQRVSFLYGHERDTARFTRFRPSDGLFGNHSCPEVGLWEVSLHRYALVATELSTSIDWPETVFWEACLGLRYTPIN